MQRRGKYWINWKDALKGLKFLTVKFTFKKGQFMTFHIDFSNSYSRRVEEKIRTVGV